MAAITAAERGVNDVLILEATTEVLTKCASVVADDAMSPMPVGIRWSWWAITQEDRAH